LQKARLGPEGIPDPGFRVLDRLHPRQLISGIRISLFAPSDSLEHEFQTCLAQAIAFAMGSRELEIRRFPI
jgi:hypothetical protein